MAHIIMVLSLSENQSKGGSMNNIELLSDALDYIEAHLKTSISTDDIVRYCHCSKSSLEKLFKCVNHISVHDYIVRRRMVKAARELAMHPTSGILDIALAYGYNSHESFARAFYKVWNCNPSKFRERYRFSEELYPRMLPPIQKGDFYMQKHVDISELYDLFKKREGCYFVCCDIKSLVPINEISYKAGDLAILESMKRMSDAAGDDDFVFRIGGDEFALLTASTDVSYAEQIAAAICSKNGENFTCDGRDIPLSLHTTVTCPNTRHLKYDELFTDLHSSIRGSKNSK